MTSITTMLYWADIRLGVTPQLLRDARTRATSPIGEHLIRDAEIPSVYDEAGKRDPHSWFGYLMSEPVQSELFRIATARGLREHPQQNA